MSTLARLQMLLETKRLRILRNMRESGTLVRELIARPIRPSGALKVGPKAPKSTTI